MNEIRSAYGFFLLLLTILLVLVCVSSLYESKTAIAGWVLDQDGNPIVDARVRVKSTPKFVMTGADGRFLLSNLDKDQSVKLTAWAEGYFIGGGESFYPGTTDVEIVLYAHHMTDNPEYEWLPSVYHPGEGEDQGCAACHSNLNTDIAFPLPVDEWLLDAHSQSAVNPRFLSMYAGTDLSGNKSPPTRYGFSKDYGEFPLLPDPDKPYFGPGYQQDFPQSAGNCAACHIPLAAIDNPYGVDPTTVSGVALEGVSCDFCHKVWDVNLDPVTGLPYPNMPGVLSFSFLRPPEGHQFFAGPLDDVAPGEDTYTPIQQESQFCAPCHQGVFWDTVVYDSFGEWLASPYSDPKTGQTCQDCHMPPTGASLFAIPEEGGEERDPGTIFSHYMPGAMDEKLLQNAVTLTVEAQQDKNAIIVEVNILNDLTGHHVPTDSPLRHLILHVKATYQGEDLLLLDGPVLPDWTGVGDPARGYYAGLPGKSYAKILREIWTGAMPSGAYWNPTHIESDNRLGAFESDTSRYRFVKPLTGTVDIEVELWIRRAFIEVMDLKDWDTPDILMEKEQISLHISP
jgi:hypothetical protein